MASVSPALLDIPLGDIHLPEQSVSFTITMCMYRLMSQVYYTLVERDRYNGEEYRDNGMKKE